MGYPKRIDSQSTRGDTYERVSWGVLGIEIILDNPMGIGILRKLPEQMRARGIDFSGNVYTHSGWIDLGLAFGIPKSFIDIRMFYNYLDSSIGETKNALPCFNSFYWYCHARQLSCW
jgi:hypothetical protein